MKIRIFPKGTMAKRQNRSTLRRREAINSPFHHLIILSFHHFTISSFYHFIHKNLFTMIVCTTTIPASSATIPTDCSSEVATPDTLEIVLWRTHFTNEGTLGMLFINGSFFCHTLEPRARPLGARKVPGKTAIPTGTYQLRLDRISPRFSHFKRYPWARVWGGKMPYLCNVPGFQAILIHVGNTPNDTKGCILVGEAKTADFIFHSVTTFRRLMQRLSRHPRHVPLYISVRTHPQARNLITQP